MKKLFLAMAVLLLAVLAAIAFLTPAGFLPAADSLEPGYAQGEDGVTYVIENRALQSCLYGVDDSGAVVSLYRELGAWRFDQLAAEDGAAAVFRQNHGNGHGALPPEQEMEFREWNGAAPRSRGCAQAAPAAGAAARSPRRHRSAGFCTP